MSKEVGLATKRLEEVSESKSVKSVKPAKKMTMAKKRFMKAKNIISAQRALSNAGRERKMRSSLVLSLSHPWLIKG